MKQKIEKRFLTVKVNGILSNMENYQLTQKSFSTFVLLFSYLFFVVYNTYSCKIEFLSNSEYFRKKENFFLFVTFFFGVLIF